jgi:hypothetical protein
LPTLAEEGAPLVLRPVARVAVLRHIAWMIERPCKPGEDLKRLWRMLLPGMSFPACGLPLEFNQTPGDNAGSDTTDDNAGRNGKRGAGAR